MEILKIKKLQKYSGFSLLEMIITIAIIALLMVFIVYTINTMIKSSIISSIRFQSRNEVELIFEVLKKNIQQTDPANILIYNSSSTATVGRGYNKANGVVTTLGDVGYIYNHPLDVGDVNGNEIQILPSGSNRWICIGYFKASDGQGFIVKSSIPNENHADCFDSSKSEYKKNAMVLNSDNINIKKFSLVYYLKSSGNAVFTIDIIAASLKNYGHAPLPELTRQLVITTQKLTF